ncbi:MAG: leucine-rich repeat protein, partial [Clostridia bacterium]|nr:leucine-rich repeat protein [Clostridia bacterium]
PSKTGYTFGGWYFGDYEWNFGYNTVTEKLTLKARWIAINYSITYELDGGTNNESNLQSYNADNNITFAEATKDGYKFMGWFVDSEFKNEITSTNGYHQHLTVFAKWARINKITYELNGGTNNIDNPTTFFEYEEVVLKAPTKDDEYKVFTGWFLDNHYEEKIETIPAGTAEDIKLWAKWEDIFKIDNKGEQYEKITGLTAVGKTLKKLAIPRNVKGIGNFVFANSDILEEVVFNGNDKVTLGYGSFQNCSKLTSVILPSGTRNIEEASFKDCISLTSITIPSSVWKICSFSFSGCTNLETVIFETNSELEEIMDNVFENCAKLKNITLPSSLITIKSSAFEGCSALEAISIPQNVESIWDYAFADCSSLKSVTFAENCKLAGISRSTFAGCSALETITIPSGVQNIGENAFNGCSKLASVDFEAESQLKCIYDAAFYSCYS